MALETASTDGTVTDTSSAAEPGTADQKPVETAEGIASSEAAAATEAPAPEKKYTDEDMKAVRVKYQGETKKEFEARIRAEAKAEVLEKIAAGKTPETQPAQTPSADQSPQRPARPLASNFGTEEEFLAAQDKYDDDLHEWRQSESDKRTAAAQQHQTAEQAEKAIMSSVKTQVEEGRKKHADFDDVVTNNEEFRITGTMTVAMASMKNGDEIAYYLGKNPEERARIVSLGSGALQAAEIGLLSSRLPGGSSPPPATRTTSAPQPPATVGAKTSVSHDTSLEGKTQKQRIPLLEEAARNRRIREAGH